MYARTVRTTSAIRAPVPRRLPLHVTLQPARRGYRVDLWIVIVLVRAVPYQVSCASGASVNTSVVLGPVRWLWWWHVAPIPPSVFPSHTPVFRLPLLCSSSPRFSSRTDGLPRQLLTFARDTFAWRIPTVTAGAAAAGAGAGAGAGGGGGGGGGGDEDVVEDVPDASARAPGINALRPQKAWAHAFVMTALAGGSSTHEKWRQVAPTDLCSRVRMKEIGVAMPRPAAAGADADPLAFSSTVTAAATAAAEDAPRVGARRRRDEDDDDDDDDGDSDETSRQTDDERSDSPAPKTPKKKKKDKKKKHKKKRKTHRGTRGGSS